MESYIGAIFVDSEYNFAEVERFFDEHVRWFFEDMNIYDTFANNHPTVSNQGPDSLRPAFGIMLCSIKHHANFMATDASTQHPYIVFRLWQLPAHGERVAFD